MAGLSKAKVYNISGFDKDSEKIEISFKTPLVSILNLYDAVGKVLIFSVTGQGNMKVSYGKVEVEIINYSSEILFCLFLKNYRKFRRKDEICFSKSYQGW